MGWFFRRHSPESPDFSANEGVVVSVRKLPRPLLQLLHREDPQEETLDLRKVRGQEVLEDPRLEADRGVNRQVALDLLEGHRVQVREQLVEHKVGRLVDLLADLRAREDHLLEELLVDRIAEPLAEHLVELLVELLVGPQKEPRDLEMQPAVVEMLHRSSGESAESSIVSVDWPEQQLEPPEEPPEEEMLRRRHQPEMQLEFSEESVASFRALEES